MRSLILRGFRSGFAPFIALLGLLCTQAHGGGFYLNDVKVGAVDLFGLEGAPLKLDGAKVRTDGKGNVYIEVKGYAVKVDGPAAPKNTGGDDPPQHAVTLTRRYFLVTEQTAPGMTDYDIDVYINSKWVRKLRSVDEQVVAEITKYLTPGKNRVVLSAVKAKGADRKSLSPDHTFRVIIGEGNVGGDNVMIDSPLVSFGRTAADTEDLSSEFSFVTR